MAIRDIPRRPRPPLLVALAMLLCAAALPAGAAAETYTVTSTSDEADETVGAGGCMSPLNGCTLRAAIQESNFSTAVDDTIAFGASFDGASSTAGRSGPAARRRSTNA